MRNPEARPEVGQQYHRHGDYLTLGSVQFGNQ